MWGVWKFLEGRFSCDVPVVGLYLGVWFVVVEFLGGFSIVGVGSLLFGFGPLFFFGTDVSGSVRGSSFVFLFCPDFFFGFGFCAVFLVFGAGLRDCIVPQKVFPH